MQIFHFRVIHDVLNLRTSMLVVLVAHNDSLLLKTLNLRSNKFMSIREISVLARIQYNPDMVLKHMSIYAVSA